MNQEIPPSPSNHDEVHQVVLGNRTFFIVGTAHISRASVELAEATIRDIKPQSVAIELCEPRLKSLKDPERWKKTDIVSIIRQGKAYVLMSQLMLAAFQKKLGDRLQVKPGTEMLRAAQVAEELGAQVVLADREVTVTLKRTWGALGFWSMCKVIWGMFAGLFSTEQFQEHDIERLKSADALDELMKDFSKALPEVRSTLIDERDQYLAAKIAEAPGERVVAVVGAGHVAGIKQWLGKHVDVQSLEVVPKPGMFVRVFAWGIPALVVGLIAYGFFTAGAKASIDMITTWIWVTGAFAALGAALSLAHPLTILSAFVASPITTIHPFLASGWIAGLVEAMIHKPRVSDLETITDDLSTYRGLWKNRLSRILLVMVLTNIFGSIGALVGIKMVASLL